MENFNLPKERKSEDVEKMFSEIAPRYDFLNHFLSFGFDKIWRKKAVKRFSPKENEIYLDLCCGTGDFGIELAKLGNTTIVGLDFSLEMLKIAKRKSDKIFFINGDALSMPFKDEIFDGAIVAFGIRNFEKLEKGISETGRVLKKNSLLVILEFPNKVESIFAPIFNFYFKFILPFLGKIVSGSSFAYKYLPQSTKFFPTKNEIKLLLGKYNLSLVEIKDRTCGIVIEIVAKKIN